MTSESERLRSEINRLSKRLEELGESLNSCEETQLRQQEKEDLFSAGPVVLFKWQNRENWPVEYVSANVEEVLGYTAEDFLEFRVQYIDLIHPDDLDRTMQEVTHNLAEKSQRFKHKPYRMKTRSGEYIWLSDHTVVTYDRDGNFDHLVGYVIDITEQIEARNLLRESEERWHFALEGARDGVWDWDATTNKVFFSDQWKSMLGYEPHEISDDLSEWETRVHPEDMESVMADLTPHLEGKTEYYENAHRVLCKDGSYKWILDRGKVIKRDSGGAPLRVIGTHTDLTEYKRIQEEIEKAHQHIAQILESTTDAYFELDKDFRFTYINKRAERSLQLKREETLGKNIWEVFPQSVGTIFYKKYHEALQRQEIVEFEAYSQPFDIWVHVNVYPTPETLSVYFKDITERKRLELEREKLFTLSMDMICIAGVDGMLKKINPAWEKTLGWPEVELTSRPWIDFVHPDDIEMTLEAGAALLDGQTVNQFQNRYRCKDGSYRWLSWNSVPQLNEGLIFCVVRDVTEQKRIERELEILATTDPLTEQLNRRSFMERANEAWSRFERYGRPCSTIMLDLDHFKRVNDTHGHKAGDKVLRALAKTVESVLREVDSLGRVGGEEFAVLLPETDAESALQAAERIRTKVEKMEVPFDGEIICVTVSLGVACARESDSEFDDILRRADEALYRAKDAGRNQVKSA